MFSQLLFLVEKIAQNNCSRTQPPNLVGCINTGTLKNKNKMIPIKIITKLKA